MRFKKSHLAVSIFIISIMCLTLFKANSFNNELNIDYSITEDSADLNYDFTKSPIFENTSKISQWDNSSRYVNEIEVEGTTAYIASSYDGLIILDISNPSIPVKIGQYEMPDKYVATEVAVDDDIAFVGCHDDGIISLDISNLSDIQFLDRFDDDEDDDHYVTDIIAEDGIVYVANNNEIDILDATDPSDIELLSVVEEEYVRVIEKYDDYILTKTYPSNNLSIIDVTNPSTPTNYTLDTLTFNDIKISNDLAYLVGSYTIEIVNLTDIGTPVIENSSSIPYYFYEGAAIDSDTLYLVHSDKVILYNLTDPINPILITSYSVNTDENPSAICIAGDSLLVGLNSIGLEIFGVSNKSAPVRQGSFLYYGDFADISVADDLAYVISDKGFLIFNISDIQYPQIVNFTRIYSDDSYGLAIAAIDDIVYLVINENLTIFDVTNPVNPILINSSYIDSTRDLVISENYLFATQYDYLKIFDITNPLTPIEITSYDVDETAETVYIKDNYAFIANEEDGILILNITDVENPVELRQFFFGEVEGLEVYGDYLYSFCEGYGIFILDISEMENIVLVNTVLIGDDNMGRIHLAMDGHYLYLSREEYGIYIFDCTDPENIILAGRYDDQTGYSVRFCVIDEIIYSADLNDGLEIIKFHSDLYEQPTSENNFLQFLRDNKWYFIGGGSGLIALIVTFSIVIGIRKKRKQ